MRAVLGIIALALGSLLLFIMSKAATPHRGELVVDVEDES